MPFCIDFTTNGSEAHIVRDVREEAEAILAGMKANPSITRAVLYMHPDKRPKDPAKAERLDAKNPTDRAWFEPEPALPPARVRVRNAS